MADYRDIPVAEAARLARYRAVNRRYRAVNRRYLRNWMADLILGGCVLSWAWRSGSWSLAAMGLCFFAIGAAAFSGWRRTRPPSAPGRVVDYPTGHGEEEEPAAR